MIFHLLIVDDEAPIRKGLSRFIRWDAIDCAITGTACDGLEAMALLEETLVDIVITDIRMPEADGLELARHIHEHHPDTQVIILTGFADFDYARTAIQYDVSDFLLKPISKEQVVAAVQAAQKKIITARRSRHARQTDLLFLKDQLLQELTSHPEDGDLAKRLREYGVGLESYRIAAFKRLPSGGDGAWREEGDGQAGLAASDHIGELKELVATQSLGCCYRYDSLILCLCEDASDGAGRPQSTERAGGTEWTEGTDRTDGLPCLLTRCREIIDMARSLYGMELSVGVSGRHHAAGEYAAAVSEAIHALTRNFYSSSHIACHDGGLPSESGYSLSAEEALSLNELEAAIIGRDFGAATSIVNSIFNRMKSRFTKSADAKNTCTMICYIGFRALVKKGKEPMEPILDRISQSTDIFGLEECIRGFLESLQRELSGERPYSKIVRQAIDHIHGHLASPLSLDSIAGEIPVNPSYLSRTFKKETGQALTEYINQARIERSKELLADGSNLNYEVAEQVGFHNPAYFSAIFKKQTGMSPREYKSGFSNLG